MSKQAIRKEQLAIRKALTNGELENRSAVICAQAISLIEATGAKTIHLFLPIDQFNEVNTKPLYQHLLEQEAYTPVISKTHWEKRHLSHHPMTNEDELKVSGLGIPEPVHEQVIDPKALDLVLVPLLAFDLQGMRLGYGAGLYDRFLAQCPKRVKKVGLSLLPPLQEALPCDEFDIPLDLCLTAENCFDFRSF